MKKIRYVCSRCGADGVKLWRQYQTFANHTELLCAKCALEDQDKEGPVDEGGYRKSDLIGSRARTDQIGWFVPAVPTEEGDTFWGYTSVPLDGVAWWRALPTGPS